MALMHCSECQNTVSDKAATCPHCGAPVSIEIKPKTPHQTAATTPASQPDNGAWRVVLIVIGLAMAALIGLGLIFPETKESLAGTSESASERLAERRERHAELERQKIQQKTAAEARDRQAGFHCLSGWDGSHSAFKSAVKNMMRNPKSFEHVETKVSPVKNGQHTIVMTYRAENGFGGMTVGQAVGTYKNSDCSHTVVAVD